jgi:hypothetical protein
VIRTFWRKDKEKIKSANKKAPLDRGAVIDGVYLDARLWAEASLLQF